MNPIVVYIYALVVGLIAFFIGIKLSQKKP